MNSTLKSQIPKNLFTNDEEYIKAQKKTLLSIHEANTTADITLNRIKDSEQHLYDENSCWKNSSIIFKKLQKLKPLCFTGHRIFNNKKEKHPHYWVELNGAVWDCNMCLTPQGRAFHYIIYNKKKEFYDRYNIKNKKNFTYKMNIILERGGFN